ncbi:MAG: hypothetical protein J0H84_20035 [Rhizobiales bacterium]|nr:hypothetical protein [Hyphomicrobiales bacterium]
MDKERFDTFLALAQYWADRKEARSQIEWKVTLGIWAILVGAISLYVNRPFHCPYWLLTIIPVAHALWLRGIWVGDSHDARMRNYWVSAAQDLAEHSSMQPLKLAARPTWIKGHRKAFGFLASWSPVLQLAITLLLTVFLALLANGDVLLRVAN